MTQKHQYIKQLYKEGDTIGLENEINKLEEIINVYNKKLIFTIKNEDKDEIEKTKANIKYNENILKFTKRIKCMLYEKLEKGDENNNK